MRAALAAVLCLAASAPSLARAADEAALWNAAFSLDDPTQARQAEATLLAGGSQALFVLLKVARSGGDSAALQVLASSRCASFSLSSGRFRHWHGDRGGRSADAAALAARMLAADPSLGRSLLASRSAFDRAVGIVGAAGDEARLAEALRATRDDSDPLVTEVAQEVARCGAAARSTPKGSPALAAELKVVEERAQKLQAAVRCEEPGFLAGVYLDGILAGRFKAGGWSRSGDDFTITITREGDQRSSLAPACALAIYDAAVKKQQYFPELAVPIAECFSVPMKVRDAAAQRAVRDLERFEAKSRNNWAARLVVAGYRVPVRVAFRADDTFMQEKELEAAILQGDPKALAALETKMFCPAEIVDSKTHLLGLLSSPETADRAAQIAERCPKSRCEATAALVRLGDPRAVPLLGRVFGELGACFGDGLEQAIHLRPSTALIEELRRLAEKDVREAKEILGHLERDGLAR